MTRSEQHLSEECRCLCGQLLARWIGGNIQVKCKRCRRVITIAFSRHNQTELAAPRVR